MQTAYAQAVLLVGVFVSGAFGDLVRGTASADGLCTYTFRDVCVGQRMSDVKKLKATVDSQQAQITLLMNCVADLRATMKKQQKSIDEIGETMYMTIRKQCFIWIRYTTLHYATLHYTTLHYTTLHYTTLHNTTLHYTTYYYDIEMWAAFHCVGYIDVTGT